MQDCVETPSVAELVLAAQSGDGRAFACLYREFFSVVFSTAMRTVRNSADAADVAHDTFVRAWQKIATLREPAAFPGWVARIAHNLAANHVRVASRVELHDPDWLHDDGSAPRSATEAAERMAAYEVPEEAAADRDVQRLVWQAAEALNERDAAVLDLHLHHDLDAQNIAEALGITPNNAHQLVFRLRKRLAAALHSRVLWRDGNPACPDLRAALHDAGVKRFDARAVKVTSAHAVSCVACQEAQRTRLDPALLFSSIGLVPIALVARDQVGQRLAESGALPADWADATAAPISPQAAADATTTGTYAAFDGASDAASAPPTTPSAPSGPAGATGPSAASTSAAPVVGGTVRAATAILPKALAGALVTATVVTTSLLLRPEVPPPPRARAATTTDANRAGGSDRSGAATTPGGGSGTGLDAASGQGDSSGAATSTSTPAGSAGGPGTTTPSGGTQPTSTASAPTTTPTTSPVRVHRYQVNDPGRDDGTIYDSSDTIATVTPGKIIHVSNWEAATYDGPGTFDATKSFLGATDVLVDGRSVGIVELAWDGSLIDFQMPTGLPAGQLVYFQVVTDHGTTSATDPQARFYVAPG